MKLFFLGLLFVFFDEVLFRFDGFMHRVVGEVEEEGLFFAFIDEFDGFQRQPIGEILTLRSVGKGRDTVWGPIGWWLTHVAPSYVHREVLTQRPERRAT